jgi:hypothetical protein
MSEVLYTSTHNNEGVGLPAGYEKLDGIKVLKANDGPLSFSGLIVLGEGDHKIERTVQKLPDLAQMWGYDPEESLAEWNAYIADPEKWEMKHQMELLKAQMSDLATRNEALEAKVNELENGKIPPIPTDPRYPYRERFAARLKRYAVRGPAPPEYYFTDDNGRYHLDEQGERIYIADEEPPRSGRAIAIGAAALALLGLGGYTLHEIEEIEHGQAKAHNVQPNHFLEHQNSILQNKVTKLDIQATKNSRADKIRDKVILANQADIDKKLQALSTKAGQSGDILKRLKDLQSQEQAEATNPQTEDNNGTGAGGYSSSPNTSGAQAATLSYRGDTVYNEVARRVKEKLGIGASDSKIKKATGYVLRLNGLRWNGGGSGTDAHKLPIGFRFKIPDNIAAIANK